MLLETSLIAKVIILLLPQVIIFLGIPIYMVLAARKAVFSGESVFGLRFREAYNLERKLDVAIDWDDEFTWKSFANVYILLFIFLIINSVNNLLGANLLFSIPVMTFTSLLLGIWIGLLVLWLDENTGVSALITLFIILLGGSIPLLPYSHTISSLSRRTRRQPARLSPLQGRTCSWGIRLPSPAGPARHSAKH